jgi:hypothetical protein
MSLTTNQRQIVMAALNARGVRACPLCANNGWTLGEELVTASTTSLAGGMVIGGPTIPMIQLVCNRCGFVSHHAVGVLGIKLDNPPA